MDPKFLAHQRNGHSLEEVSLGFSKFRNKLFGGMTFCAHNRLLLMVQKSELYIQDLDSVKWGTSKKSCGFRFQVIKFEIKICTSMTSVSIICFPISRRPAANPSVECLRKCKLVRIADLLCNRRDFGICSSQ